MVMTIQIVEYFSISLPIIAPLDAEGNLFLVAAHAAARALLSPGQLITINSGNFGVPVMRTGFLGNVEESAGRLVVKVRYAD